jgi:hypothetical protein
MRGNFRFTRFPVYMYLSVCVYFVGLCASCVFLFQIRSPMLCFISKFILSAIAFITNWLFGALSHICVFDISLVFGAILFSCFPFRFFVHDFYPPFSSCCNNRCWTPIVLFFCSVFYHFLSLLLLLPSFNRFPFDFPSGFLLGLPSGLSPSYLRTRVYYQRYSVDNKLKKVLNFFRLFLEFRRNFHLSRDKLKISDFNNYSGKKLPSFR